MALEFGPLQLEDAAACAEIGGDVFAGINIPYFLERQYGLSGYGGRMNAYWTRSLLQSDPRHFLVARDGAEVVAFAGLSAQKQFGIGCLVHLGVKRSRQNQGIGRQLVQAGIEHLRAQDLDVAWIAYDAGNERAGHLYRKLGFADFEGELYLDRAMPGPEERAALALRIEPALEALLERLPGGQPVFPEERLAELYGLAADRRALRRYYLACRMGPGLTAYVPASGDDRSFVIAGREADGPVLRLSMVCCGGTEAAAALLQSVLVHESAAAGKPPFVACYVDRHLPVGDSLQALAAAGFSRTHSLVDLAQRL